MTYPKKNEDGTLPGGAPDLEVFDLMKRLSDLQTWCFLMAQKDSGGIDAGKVVQDTRCLIVERLYPRAKAYEEQRKAELEDGGYTAIRALKDHPHDV